MGSNSQVFEFQTELLRQALGPQHEYEFVDGTIECDPTPDIATSFPTCHKYYSYFEREPNSINAALDDLEEYLTTNGPFDGIWGISQGAMLAATYLARRYPKALEHSSYQSIKCAIFICAMPLCILDDGDPRLATSDIEGELVRIPTAHIYGALDPSYEKSISLKSRCRKDLALAFDHGGGHELPRSHEKTTGMAETVAKTIDQALLGA
ncbi:hypothetical protein K469DRAFT_710446 [Zopfia rhizophila CBS 207.26]|uniref:Serine hydrolase domain-containing protein n=1 Tax=Zopfia rhizophila CBS 207.26 TaxID=1314779 RepID=A0A6A6DVC7_9PEZI|nr:hypothetical protein K469DRAFT_710446 [Zopfia rhizophila CBS 207.26]